MLCLKYLKVTRESEYHIKYNQINKSVIQIQTSCSDGYLKVYLKGQETIDAYDKFDHELCGEEANPVIMVSDGPRLLMVFSSGELMGRGFKANYTFETGKFGINV